MEAPPWAVEAVILVKYLNICHPPCPRPPPTVGVYPAPEAGRVVGVAEVQRGVGAGPVAPPTLEALMYQIYLHHFLNPNLE